MYKIDPERQRIQDIEDLPRYREKFHAKVDLTPEDEFKYSGLVTTYFSSSEESWDLDKLNKVLGKIRKEKKIVLGRQKLRVVYRKLVDDGKIPNNPSLNEVLIGKKVRSHSGVLVITVFTSPYPDGQKFSCQWDCAYCPSEPDQPKSYLLKEPGVLRANQENFDPVRQMNSRLKTLETLGHPLDKLEILVLGGTWESYPKSYRESFIRDIFYSANNYYNKYDGKKLSLELEQQLNENARIKIIGVTIETRPDTINPEMIRELRRLGVTRLQIGIQHTDNGVLKKINRRSKIEDAYKALFLLKECGFKVDIHIMPNLPGSSPQMDREMFQQFLHSPQLQADQWKIYPCEVVPWTEIENWYREGTYVPYSEEELKEVIIEAKTQVHPWIRLNRIIRDIPSEYVIGGFDNPSLRDEIKREMKKRGLVCRCIRCREVQGREITQIKETIYSYESHGGVEKFISLTNDDESILYGFLRLRFPSSSKLREIFPLVEENYALIRELHVYGKINPTRKEEQGGKVQHRGMGKRLLQLAEELSRKEGKKRMVVISGVGTRNYYEKQGFKLLDKEGGWYMEKEIPPQRISSSLLLLVLLMVYLFVIQFF